MTLQEYTDTLPARKQFEIAINLTRRCLPIWNDYADNNPLSYTDSVVGMAHKVDKTILIDALDTIEQYLRMSSFRQFLVGKRSLKRVRSKFDEPIVALQDDDWQLPYPVEHTIYAVYNLLERALGQSKTTFGASTIYVCINQAADALDSAKILTQIELKELIYSTHGH